MLASAAAVADDGVLVDFDQAAGLADTTAFGEVFEDGEGLILGEAAVEEGSAFAFGEAGFAGGATEEAALEGAIAHGDGEVAVGAFAEVGAIRIQTAKAAEILVGAGDRSLAHGSTSAPKGPVPPQPKW
jgi:hypothetical protein